MHIEFHVNLPFLDPRPAAGPRDDAADPVYVRRVPRQRRTHRPQAEVQEVQRSQGDQGEEDPGGAGGQGDGGRAEDLLLGRGRPGEKQKKQRRLGKRGCF